MREIQPAVPTTRCALLQTQTRPHYCLCSFISSAFLVRTETRTEASCGKRASSCCHIKYASSSCPRLFLTRRSFADGSRRPTTSHAMSCTQTTGKCKVRFPLQVEAPQHTLRLLLPKSSVVQLVRNAHQGHAFLCGLSVSLCVTVLPGPCRLSTTYSLPVERDCTWWWTTRGASERTTFRCSIASALRVLRIRPSARGAMRVQVPTVTGNVVGAPPSLQNALNAFGDTNATNDDCNTW